MKLTNYLKTKLGKSLHLLSGISASMILLATTQSNAQSTSEIIKSNSHIGGYHIKCYGQATGVLEALPSFGTEPYTFLWNTGETTALITDKPAGIYYVTAIDVNNNMQTDTFELKQPNAYTIESRMSDYSGYQVSSHGNNNGSVEIIANGGTPPYQYLWDNGDNLSIRSGLTAGTYTFIVSDANYCSTNGSVIITEPSPIQVSFSNVQGTSCFAGSDGKATLNISGGLGDFSVMWKNGSFSLSPDDLSAGYNSVRVFEHGKAVLDTGIQIAQPNAIESQFTLSQYNGFNVSCVDCFNGSITTAVTGGTAPYSYQWNDAVGSTSANLTNLNGGEYEVMITDGNGCVAKNKVKMTMPNPKDWSRFGNNNVDPSEFIGSTDASPLVFKINNNEVLKMATDTISFSAQLRLMNIDTTTSYVEGNRILGMDDNGHLKTYLRDEIVQGPLTPIPGYSCDGCGCSPKMAWGVPMTATNGVQSPMNTFDIVKCPAEGNVAIGRPLPEVNSKLDILGEIAISGERLNVAYNGNVGVGTAFPTEKLHLFGGNFRVTCPWDNLNPVFFVDHLNKNAGVGTASPRGKFEIKSSEADIVTFGAMRTEASGWATSYMGFNAYREDGGTWRTTGENDNSGAAVIYGNTIGDLMFTTINGDGAYGGVLTADDGIKSGTRMTLSNDGRLGIGVHPSAHYDLLNYKLVVDGNVKCKKLRVDIQNWGDYVFDTNYELMDLNTIESYIAENKHLPGMPSAQQIEKDGADLGEMVKLQQVKIEELTLLMIQMQKQIDLSNKKN